MTEQTALLSRSPAAWRLDHLSNVGHVVTETAARIPDAVAVAAAKKNCPPQTPGQKDKRFAEITFRSLERRTNQMAQGFIESGIAPGDRIALLVPPGIDFVTMVFALFKAGATVILIDPGMGRKNMIRCLAEAAPVGMVGIPLAHVGRLLFRRKLNHCVKNFVVGRFWGVPSVFDFENAASDSFDPLAINREDPAAIIFTTGSTGPPKGVLYRHRIFIEQAQQIRDYFQIQPGSVDVSGFPLFALFNTAMGTTTVFPDMDPTRPAQVHPPKIIDAVNCYQADQSFGSPALWNTVSTYCEKHQIRLPTIKRILSAGAPVPDHVLKRIRSVISEDGEAFTPYGATEALPVACNSASVVIQETARLTHQGMGTCVGKAFATMRWKVIEITDQPLSNLSECRELPCGETGELIVQGETVTDQYVTRTSANAYHKIQDGENFWHRMGDLGYLDREGRFWFCGRKSHRLKRRGGDMYTVTCEAIINTHPKVYRSALVGVGDVENQTPVIIVELWPEHWTGNQAEQAAVIEQIRELAAGHWQTNQIDHFLLHRSLPVDIRHNSKIFREQLGPWAAKKLGV